MSATTEPAAPAPEALGPIDVIIIGYRPDAPMTGDAVPLLMDLVDSGVDKAAVDPFFRPPAVRLTPPPGGLRMTPESLVNLLLTMDSSDDQIIEPTETEIDAWVIGSVLDGTTAEQPLDQADRLVTLALEDQTAEDHRDTLAELSQVIEALRRELAGDGGGSE